MVGNDYVTLEVATSKEVASSSSVPKKKSKKREERAIHHDTPSDKQKCQCESRRHSTQAKKEVVTEATSDRKSKKVTIASGGEDELDDDEPLIPKRHFTWMPFGHALTWGGILIMLLGLTLATLAKSTTSFVKLGQPFDISPLMVPLTDVGLVRLNICYSDDYLDALESNTQMRMPYMNSAVDISDKTTRNIPHKPCFTVRLSAEMIEDTMWEVSRLSASSAIALGAFFSLFMISTIRWESINMKPMAIGLLMTYLLQSFSFFFYDAQICRDRGCTLGLGTYLSILASFCWFGASMICILMDVHHTRKMRHLARLERRRRRRLRRQKLKRKLSTETTRTETCSSDGIASEHSLNSPPEVNQKEIHDAEEGMLWQL